MSRALAAALALALLSPAAHAETVRLLVVIGANVGNPDDLPLRYADADAERVRRVFVEVGAVPEDQTYLVLDQPAPKVRQRLAEVQGRIAGLRASGREVALLLYVSSHAQAGVLHLMGTQLPLSELREFAEGSGARLRILIVDACDSGAIARVKGGRQGTGYEVALEQLPLHGQVIITSSGPAQASEEWETLRGSLFTHHLVTGLRGDADSEGDGKVTLAEAYAYAYRRTVAGASRASQQPVYDIDLSGTGELVLTEPAMSKSAIILEAPAAGAFVISSQPRADVVAEIDKGPGRSLRIAVPPGRYLVRKRLGRSLGLSEVELPFGGEREVHESELVWRDFTEVALKGGEVELRPWTAFLLGSAETAPVQGTGIRYTGGVSLRYTRGPWWLRGGLGGTGARYRGVDLAISERALSLKVGAGYRWLAWPVVPYAGLLAEAVGIEQRFARDHESDIQGTFGGMPLPEVRTLGLGLGPAVGLEAPLPGAAVLLAEVQLSVRHLAAAQQPSWRASACGALAVGWRF